MGFRVVMDGNAFYEIDEDCMKRRKKAEGPEQEKREIAGNRIGGLGQEKRKITGNKIGGPEQENRKLSGDKPHNCDRRQNEKRKHGRENR